VWCSGDCPLSSSRGEARVVGERGYAAFLAWLTGHPLADDRPFGASSVRYQVARYCDYLQSNPWPHGDPLRDPAAREGAVEAYLAYLRTFQTPAETIRSIRLSLEHFSLFLDSTI
jgi:hypothetical protein